MPGHDIIVIGASSGGVEVLTTLVSRLPETLRAAIFIVLHVRPDAPSLLPAILNRAGTLPAAHALDGEPIRTGRIYVAPPGRQLYLHKRRVSVELGPRENMHRPAIDPLFRTAAHHHGSRVIGVIVSGALDDGTAGLQAVKGVGGIAVVQDPADAACASMPTHAMARVAVDHCVKAVDLPDLLVRLVGVPSLEPAAPAPLDAREEPDGTFEHVAGGAPLGFESGLTCPECSGILREVRDGDVLRFRCRVGHAYSSQTLLRKLAENARMRGHDGVADLFDDRSVALDRDVHMLRDLLARGRALDPIGDDRT
jgi:two-component system chemotaxis response regulator CheB